jgi:hypothetical protein
MAPVVHGLEQKWSGKVGFVYLDIDDSHTAPFKRNLGYIYQPNIFLIDGDGQILQQWVGPAAEGELQAALERAAQLP